MTEVSQTPDPDPGADVAPGLAPPVVKVRSRRARKPRKRPRKRGRIGLWLVLVLVVMALVLGVVGMALTGRSLSLPVWAVAEVETRLNRKLAGTHLPPGAALAVGQIELALDRDFSPRLRLRDLRLIEPSGKTMLALPEVAVAMDAGALLIGQARITSVRLLGAHLEAQRDAEGRIGLSVGGLSGARAPQSLGDVLDALDRMFSTPTLAGLDRIEADALTLTLTDARAGRQWQLGDGRMVLENRDTGLAAELSVTLLDGATPAQARLTIETDKTTSAARIIANLQDMDAADLAAQAPPLAALGLLDAPISGRMLGELRPDGALKGFEATLTLGKGAVKPSEDARPVPFERAEMALRYDPQRQRITLGSLRLESASLRIKARGIGLLQDATGDLAAPGKVPAVIIGQLSFSEVMVDPEGLFEEPVRFDTGSLAIRLTLSPFHAEIGELTFGEGEDQLRLDGDLAAGEGGWRGGLNVSLGRISADRLVKLWPVSVVPKTRAWLAANVGQGQFLDVDAGLRFAPGAEPHFGLDYDFQEAEVRFIRTLPPVQDGRGRASIFGNTYTVVLDGGHVTAPGGGVIDATGSMMRVADITKIPADAEVHLTTVSDLTAALSLLDQEPFRFLTKAGRPVDMGQGRAELASDLRFPLKAKIEVQDVTYAVKGRIKEFRSTVMVPGRVIAVPDLGVSVTADGLELQGTGTLDDVGFTATLRQPFGPKTAGTAEVSAKVRLTDKGLRSFGVALPQGWLSGETEAQVEMTIPKGAPLTMKVSSSLVGATLKVPPLSWSKSAKTKGSLTLEATLGSQPKVDNMVLTAPGLKASGQIRTGTGGVFDRARFTTLQAGDWLDAAVDLIGQGRNRAPKVEVLNGTLDLRKMPGGGTSGGATDGNTEMKVALDQLIVSSGITLTRLRGAFLSRRGGLDGSFAALVNGKAEITGTVVPDQGRTALRVTSRNAGRVMAAAGIFASGRGGALDMTLRPRGPEGQYVGSATFSSLSVQDAPVLAALLSSISVVGLLEQLGGNGLVFESGEVEFVLSPLGVQITRGSAVGASLGISFEGAYSSGSGRLDMQGVISPIYILNGIGQIFSRKGEGLFGFNYRLTGSADKPIVSVNPLSILTPGMFRELFRRAPPVVKRSGG
ncbi:MAG: hypothetical protein WAT09_17995 [Paracoccaceae bacterium]